MTAPVRVLLTACGSPGSATMIRMLHQCGCYVIGVDMNPEAVGRWMCDEFRIVPPARDPVYIAAITAEADYADVILPQSSREIPRLSELAKARFPVPILASSPEAVALANNKRDMYYALDGIVPIPRRWTVHQLESVQQAVAEFGAAVIKPPVGKGSRGCRIIDPNVSMRDVIDGKPGSSKYATLVQVEEAYKDDFPEMLVMEYLDGEELAVDALCMDGELLLYTVRTVETQRAGVVMTGEIVDRPEIVEQTRAILKAIPLSYCVNLQFIGGKLIEINPRASTFIYQDDVVMPWLAIQLALGRVTTDGIRSYQSRIQIGRRMARYMDQVFY